MHTINPVSDGPEALSELDVSVARGASGRYMVRFEGNRTGYELSDEYHNQDRSFRSDIGDTGLGSWGRDGVITSGSGSGQRPSWEQRR